MNKTIEIKDTDGQILYSSNEFTTIKEFIKNLIENKKSLNGADLSNLDLSNLDLSNLDLSTVNFTGADLFLVNLHGSIINKNNFENAILDFTGLSDDNRKKLKLRKRKYTTLKNAKARYKYRIQTCAMPEMEKLRYFAEKNTKKLKNLMNAEVDKSKKRMYFEELILFDKAYKELISLGA